MEVVKGLRDILLFLPNRFHGAFVCTIDIEGYASTYAIHCYNIAFADIQKFLRLTFRERQFLSRSERLKIHAIDFANAFSVRFFGCDFVKVVIVHTYVLAHLYEVVFTLRTTSSENQ